jgi:tetratricopeptide (TPR) repeat protein
VLTVETGLLYAKADPDLLAKKDSYYYSLGVDQLAAVKEKVERWFDVGYCVRKATAVANAKEADVETLDYGLHLARLARVIAPTSQSVRLVEARLLLRKGERDAALTLLEDVRQEPKGSGEEEDAWYVATRLLGDLYLDELNRPDLAVGCFSDYRSYQKSGADTLYRLGQAQEAAGNVPAAVKAFEAVTAYTSHPRYWEATEAVRRLKGQ